jgi:flavin reductase (DIM6/NTAB) family NADH-FMN oxidoreductase RutF
MSSSPFAQVVSSMDPAMIVVTASVGEERDGCLVGFHSQSSIDPERYTVWISKENHTLELVRQASHVGVHLLGKFQLDLAERFGGQTADDGVDKFAGTDVVMSEDGVPVLGRRVAGFVGRIVERIEAGGDHVAVVLEPVEVRADPAMEPLRLRDALDIDPGHPRS